MKSWVIILLNSRALETARALEKLNPNALIFGLQGRLDPIDCDRLFEEFTPFIQNQFRQGKTIIALCASGIVIRSLGPLLKDKLIEPPVLALSDDGQEVIPLIGGANGANELAEKIANYLGGKAAITASGKRHFNIQLINPPKSHILANPHDAKRITSDLLAGQKAHLRGPLPWIEQSNLPLDDNGEITIDVSIFEQSPKNGLLYIPRCLFLLPGDIIANTARADIISAMESKQIDLRAMAGVLYDDEIFGHKEKAKQLADAFGLPLYNKSILDHMEPDHSYDLWDHSLLKIDQPISLLGKGPNLQPPPIPKASHQLATSDHNRQNKTIKDGINEREEQSYLAKKYGIDSASLETSKPETSKPETFKQEMTKSETNSPVRPAPHKSPAAPPRKSGLQAFLDHKKQNNSSLVKTVSSAGQASEPEGAAEIKPTSSEKQSVSTEVSSTGQSKPSANSPKTSSTSTNSTTKSSNRVRVKAVGKVKKETDEKDDQATASYKNKPAQNALKKRDQEQVPPLKKAEKPTYKPKQDDVRSDEIQTKVAKNTSSKTTKAYKKPQAKTKPKPGRKLSKQRLKQPQLKRLKKAKRGKQNRGSLSVIGLGPGSAMWMTPEVKKQLKKAEILIGYETYLNMVPDQKGQKKIATPNRVELDRASHAIKLASKGKRVCVVSSGDPGIFAMGSAVLEAIDKRGKKGGDFKLEICPGVSAMQAAAARVGAPLGHDFAVISLSDIRKPFSIIKKRLRKALKGDFVIAIYNPASKTRRKQLKKLAKLLKKRGKKTPVLMAKNVGRKGEKVRIFPLAKLPWDEVDMRTLLIVGSSKTRWLKNKKGRDLLYTPRDYDK